MCIKKLSFFLLLPLFLFCCKDDEGGVAQLQPSGSEVNLIQGQQPVADDTEPGISIGLNYVEARRGRGKIAYRKLIDILSDVPTISIVAEIDHAANAVRNGLDLPYTSVVLFGNPELGTPLMQRNQRAGLDLPQKMLIYEYDNKDVLVAYNHVDYLGSRHGVTDVPAIDVISGALQKFARAAGNNDVIFATQSTVTQDAGILEKTTNTLSVDQVYNKLKTIVENNPALSVLAELDHQANANRVGMELRPTRLLVFGNPNLGTPLMQNERNIAVDLPQKVLVYEDEAGTVHLIYNDPFFLADRHDINADVSELTTIANALDNISTAATTE